MKKAVGRLDASRRIVIPNRIERACIRTQDTAKIAPRETLVLELDACSQEESRRAESVRQYTGRYGVSHWAMIVNRLVKMRRPIATSSAPEAISILW